MERKVDGRHAIVIGGVNLDIRGRPAAEPRLRDSNPGRVGFMPGGVGRNIAHDLRLLGVQVSLVAAFGGDSASTALLEGCRGLGLDMDMAQVFPEYGCSTYMYVTDEGGNMLLAVSDMAVVGCLTPERIAPLLPRLGEADALVLDANLPPETIACICAGTDAPIYADPVSAAKARRLLPVLPRLRAIKPNALEAEALTGEADPERAARALLRAGVEQVYVSLGKDGMLAADNGRLLRLPCREARTVDCTGAGDAATAAIVWAGLRGLDLEAALRAALRAGALTCESESANSERLRELES